MIYELQQPACMPLSHRKAVLGRDSHQQLRLPATFCALVHTSMNKKRPVSGQLAAAIQQPHEFSALLRK